MDGDDRALSVFRNPLGMEFVRVPAGSFLMGQESGGDWDERPVHRVQITYSFLMSATEVTNAQFEQFDPEHHRLRGKLGISNDDDEAVVYVSWHEAVAFCQWLSEKDDRPYRLPTEAEWEYACRAGTTTLYHTTDSLPDVFHKNVRQSWFPSERTVPEQETPPLHVGRTPPNAWGLYDMHGNVEEWCLDWYGPYEAGDSVDPVGRADGDFKVTRGGSHSTTLEYLRSANRSGALPADRHWLIGFRVVCGELPGTQPLPAAPLPRHRLHVRQTAGENAHARLDPNAPYFAGPRVYVKIPPDADGPLYAAHNHCPAIVECGNGDLLAIWYTCRTERGRELAVAASRLRCGESEWEPASLFWDTPDRNDHAPALWRDETGVLYHFNGVSVAATWGNLATILRTSEDHGATWSAARLIMPEHGLRHMPVESVFRCLDGAILLPCDAVTGGSGGTAIHLSYDDGQTWVDPGGTICGIHAAVVQLRDGRLLAFGRGEQLDGRMPQSMSANMGRTWEVSASPFPPLGGGQRAVLLRLQEGSILLCSFAESVAFVDSAAAVRTGSGLFAALSEDEGESWTVRRLITDDGPPRDMDGGGNTGRFVMGPDSAEPRGYLSICQSQNGVIHLISSRLHYAFNHSWLRSSPPAR